MSPQKSVLVLGWFPPPAPLWSSNRVTKAHQCGPTGWSAPVTDKFCLNFALFPLGIFRQAACSSFATHRFGHFILACLFRSDLVLKKYHSESCESNRIFQSGGWKLGSWLIDKHLQHLWNTTESSYWIDEKWWSDHSITDPLVYDHFKYFNSWKTVKITYCMHRAYRLIRPELCYPQIGHNGRKRVSVT